MHKEPAAWGIRFVLCSILFLGLLPGSVIPVTASPRVQPAGEKIVIVIDPGHGGGNEGTTENGFVEKSMTMTTAAAMYEELCKYDNVEVYLTRTQDVEMSLKERAEFAASVNADFLFSIHYNASLSHELYGSEVWISSQPPYHAYGYQFGCVQMQTVKDMGLFLRGVKTRLNNEGTDYYGIIRESVALSVPAVIIEHCHVDEDRDVPFCDSREDQIAFGKADALSVAKYFGLKSTALNVDYSAESALLAEASQNGRVQLAQQDMTDPDVCEISLKKSDDETGQVTIEISAADYDSMLLYYDYSIDGGNTFCPRQPWPDCNIFDGTYKDTFSTVVAVPSGERPRIIFRAYNLYDRYTESNTISFTQNFSYGEDKTAAVQAAGQAVAAGSSQTGQSGQNNGNGSSQTGQPGQGSGAGSSQEGQPGQGSGAGSSEEGQAGQDSGVGSSQEGQSGLGSGTGFSQAGQPGEDGFGANSFQPGSGREDAPEVSFLDFLKICLVIVVILFIILLTSQIIAERGRRRRRRQRRKEAGYSSRQPR